MTKLSDELLNQIKSNHSELTRLELRSQGLDDLDIERLTDALKTNLHLTELDLSGNDIGPYGAQALANTTSLRSLELWRNGVGDDGATALANNCHLTSLNLSFNFVTETGAKALASNNRLRKLDLSFNKIRNEGANALATNTTLTELNIMICDINPEAARAFFNNVDLLHLFISLNPIDDELLRQVRKSVKGNKKAKESKFIGTVIEIAKGARQTQTTCKFQKIPNDALLIIFSYLADNIRTPEKVQTLCRFLLQTIRTSKTGELRWSEAIKESGFFKASLPAAPSTNLEYSKHDPDYDQVVITKLTSG